VPSSAILLEDDVTVSTNSSVKSGCYPMALITSEKTYAFCMETLRDRDGTPHFVFFCSLSFAWPCCSVHPSPLVFPLTLRRVGECAVRRRCPPE
jgi:hypothetical protein